MEVSHHDRGRMRISRLRSTPVLLLPLCLTIAGCGYHMSNVGEPDASYRWRTLYRDDVQTVAVPIFANRTYFQGVEFRLTKAVINDLEAYSPYRVAPRERADTILEGEIERVRVRTISNNRVSAVPQEQMYTVVVRFTWRDLRSGKLLVHREEFEQSAPFYPTLGEAQFEGEQQNIEHLALAIVQALQSDWGTKEGAKPQ
jgi:hypothetical protein